jgi:hypothetical protein
MLKTTCYSIKCSSDDACEQVPARVSEYSPRLSYVRRYTDNDITKGMVHAAKYKGKKTCLKLRSSSCTTPNTTSFPGPSQKQGREDPGVGWSNNDFDWLTSY